MSKFTVAVLLLVFRSLPMFAAVPYQVADLRTLPDVAASSGPGFQASVNGITVFIGSDEETGTELYATDGTPQGTRLLKDIFPGTRSPNLSHFTTTASAIYFYATDDKGFAVWKTDGTSAGTQRASELPSDGNPVSGLGSQLIFTTTGARELWITSGTSGSNVKLATISTAGSNPVESVAATGNVVYLGTPLGLWKTDGTTSGTQLVLGEVSVTNLIVSGNLVFFAGKKGLTEPWVSDGTAAGTHLIADLTPAAPGPSLSLTTMRAAALSGHRIIFTTIIGEYWVTDGTVAGTFRLSAEHAITHPPVSTNIAVANDIAYFANDDARGIELWQSDGTSAGTSIVRDIYPGLGGSSIDGITALGSRVFFFADDNVHGREPWIVEGTSVHLLRDIHPNGGSYGGNTDTLVVGNRLYFAASDGLYGGEPWLTDGTESGTRMLANVAREKTGSSNPRSLTAAADRLYFNATGDDLRTALWSTDGSAAGTTEISPFTFAQTVAIGNTLYGSRGFAQLWKSDGTAAGTGLVRDFNQGFNTPHIGQMLVNDGHLYMIADDGHGETCWTSDGTKAGTVPLGEPPANTYFDHVFRLTTLVGRVYGLIDRLSGGSGSGLVTFDAAGPQRDVSHFEVDNYAGGFYVSAGSLYLVVPDTHNQHITRIMVSRGTADSTAVVKEFGDDVSPKAVAGAAGSLLFEKFVSGQGPEIWKSDGTAAGTVLVKDHLLNPDDRDLRFLTTIGDRTFFITTNSNFQSRLWITDGTASGTAPLTTSVVVAESENTEWFAAANGLLYFRAADNDHGTELWQSDGSAAGTRMVFDIAPGPDGSSPSGLTQFRNVLYFAATGPDGRELWALPLDTAITTADVRTKENAGTATVHVRLSPAATQRVTVSYATVDKTALANTDYTPRSGTLTFEAGETDKSIDIPIPDNAHADPERMFLVRLENASAPLERSSAAVLIDDDDARADVSITIDRAMFVVLNDGPSTASNVRVCQPTGYVKVLCQTAFELKAGETRNLVTYNTGSISAKVTAYEPDPKPENNITTWTGDDSIGVGLLISPALPQVGKPATIMVTHDTTSASPFVVPLTSSDPSILPLPASVTIPAGSTMATATVTPLRTGDATLRTNTVANATIAVHVVAAGDNRIESHLGFDIINEHRFGALNSIRVYVVNPTVDGVLATGTMTFSIDDQVVGSRPVINAFAALGFNNPSPGSHKYSVVYSGDANFFGSTAQTSDHIDPATPSLTATATAGGALILVRGVTGTQPGGTVTVSDGTKSIATNAALTPFNDSASSVSVSGITPTARALTISYSGNAQYNSVTVTIPIIGQRQHSAPH